eukprot:1990778-Prymnesium_polylepis.1
MSWTLATTTSNIFAWRQPSPDYVPRDLAGRTPLPGVSTSRYVGVRSIRVARLPTGVPPSAFPLPALYSLSVR